jgi:hypothetical protein
MLLYISFQVLHQKKENRFSSKTHYLAVFRYVMWEYRNFLKRFFKHFDWRSLRNKKYGRNEHMVESVKAIIYGIYMCMRKFVKAII